MQRAHDELSSARWQSGPWIWSQRTSNWAARSPSGSAGIRVARGAGWARPGWQDGRVGADGRRHYTRAESAAGGATHAFGQCLTSACESSDRRRPEQPDPDLAIGFDRMAKITGQLKAFARKSALHLGPVSVRRALANVQALLEQRLRTERVMIIEDWSERTTGGAGRRQPAGTGARKSRRQCT